MAGSDVCEKWEFSASLYFYVATTTYGLEDIDQNISIKLNTELPSVASNVFIIISPIVLDCKIRENLVHRCSAYIHRSPHYLI